MSETVINVTHVRGANGHPTNNPEPSNLGWIQFNIEYFFSHDGILKLVQLVSEKFLAEMLQLLT